MLGAVVGDLVGERKWDEALRTAGIPARWEQIVGAEIAAHCRPDRLEGGELTCVAESTAWATQIRLLSRTILDRLAAEVGPGVVRRLRVHGPTAPNWRHGPLRVTGRGPRDTYGSRAAEAAVAPGGPHCRVGGHCPARISTPRAPTGAR